MTMEELASLLASMCGRGILDDMLGISEAMETFEVEGDPCEMERLIRRVLDTATATSGS